MEHTHTAEDQEKSNEDPCLWTLWTLPDVFTLQPA